MDGDDLAYRGRHLRLLRERSTTGHASTILAEKIHDNRFLRLIA